MGRKEKRKSKQVYFLIAILFLVVAVNIFIYFNVYKILEIRELEASVIVSDRVGFDLNKTALTFGEIAPGSASNRIVQVGNSYKFPIEVYIFGKGGMKEFIVPARDRLEVGEIKNISISAFALNNAKFGEYHGKAIIQFKRV